MKRVECFCCCCFFLRAVFPSLGALVTIHSSTFTHVGSGFLTSRRSFQERRSGQRRKARMQLADPPLGGSRGTDANDVVVWFGDTRNGWPQRIITVEGVRHRSGCDPRSLHESAAKKLVDQHYDLGHDMLDGSRWGPEVLGEGMPRPVSTIRDLRSSRKPSATGNSANPEAGENRGFFCSSSGDHSWMQFSQQMPSRAACNGSCHGLVGVRDSPSLVLQRKSEELNGSNGATAQSQLQPADVRRRKSSLSRPPTGRSRRPTSAVSTLSSQTQDTATSSTGLTMPDARRTRSAPKTVDDFPPVTLCRDLDSTFALRRAAAVLDRWEPSSAPRDTLASGAPTRPASSSPSTTSTIAQLKKSLGSSMIHTIRQTNALHASEFQAKHGSNQRTCLSRLQQGAEDRIAYRHLPKEERARMQLRNDLEVLQTEFARREIEAELDGFKMRVKTVSSDKARAAVARGRGNSDSAGPAVVNSSGPLTAAGLHSLLQRNAASLGGARARAHRPVGRLVEHLHGVPAEYRSHLYHLRSSDVTADGMGPMIPVQSRIQVNGKTFTYSELFRPSLQTSSTGL